MAVTRFKSGDVTLTLSGDLEAIVRNAVRQVSGGLLDAMEAAAAEVADEARSDWYSAEEGVTRRSGRSGVLDVVTTVTEAEVRVSLGSTAEYAHLVRRPGALSTAVEEITEGEYFGLKRAKRACFRARTTRPREGIEAGKFYKIIHNPKASDGKSLVVELVRKPMRARIGALSPQIRTAIQERVARGGG